MSSFQGVVNVTWVWLVAKFDDVMQPVTSQVRHMEATIREISSSSNCPTTCTCLFVSPFSAIWDPSLPRINTDPGIQFQSIRDL